VDRLQPSSYERDGGRSSASAPGQVSRADSEPDPGQDGEHAAEDRYGCAAQPQGASLGRALLGAVARPHRQLRTVTWSINPMPGHDDVTSESDDSSVKLAGQQRCSLLPGLHH
jgi:hypothetical protein